MALERKYKPPCSIIGPHSHLVTGKAFDCEKEGQPVLYNAGGVKTPPFSGKIEELIRQMRLNIREDYVQKDVYNADFVETSMRVFFKHYVESIMPGRVDGSIPWRMDIPLDVFNEVQRDVENVSLGWNACVDQMHRNLQDS